MHFVSSIKYSAFADKFRRAADEAKVAVQEHAFFDGAIVEVKNEDWGTFIKDLQEVE